MKPKLCLWTIDLNFLSNSGEFFFETICSKDCFLRKQALNILSKMGINMGVAHFIDKFFLLSVIPLKVETKDYKENAYSSGCYAIIVKVHTEKLYFGGLFIKSYLVA